MTNELIERYAKGIYYLPEFYDPDYLLQLDCPEVVFSHQSALVYHRLSTFMPFRTHVIVPSSSSPKFHHYHEIMINCIDLADNEIVIMETSEGNPIRVTSLERTLYDIMTDDMIHFETVEEAVWDYARKDHQNKQQFNDYFGQDYNLKNEKESRLFLNGHAIFNEEVTNDRETYRYQPTKA